MVNSHLPPHEYLPLYILREIFAHVVTRAGIVEIPHRLTNTLPWSLSQVCSDWREIVHSDPLLWRNIRLTASITDLRNGDLDRLDRILPYGLPALRIKEDNVIHEMMRNDERSDFTLGPPLLSQLCSLHITASSAALVELLSAIPSSISLPEVSLRIKDPVIDELQNIKLFVATKNLTSLKLDIRYTTNTTIAKAFVHSPHIPFDRLTYLDLNLHDAYLSELWDILSRCISLKELSLSTNSDASIPPRLSHPFLPNLESLGMCYTINYDPFPLKRLTTLSLSCTTPQHILKILHQTVHLESLCITSVWMFGPIDNTVVRLASVQSLSLDTNSVYILDCFDFPKLTTLSMEKWNWGIMTRGLPTQRIQNFVVRSGCILELFHYESPVEGKEFKRYKLLRNLLEALPSLRDFSASYSSVLFTDDLLNEMKESMLLPKVQTLKICVASPALFADFIELRVNAELREEGFIRLKTAFAYYLPSFTDDDVRIVPETALRRLEAINNMYGTNFGMVAEW